jgi:hypothetical protein
MRMKLPVNCGVEVRRRTIAVRGHTHGFLKCKLFRHGGGAFRATGNVR